MQKSNGKEWADAAIVNFIHFQLRWYKKRGIKITKKIVKEIYNMEFPEGDHPLYHAFDWHESPQGLSFWCEIVNSDD